MAKPVIYVLAGVNGAGKSSIGGYLLTRAGLAWFNPDEFARTFREKTLCSQTDANATAWGEGVRRLEMAIQQKKSFAFETTLGGNSIPAKLLAATKTHDVIVWFCGLSSAAQHIARVKERVKAGGHDIPEEKIRERCTTALGNLIALMPELSQLYVYDNSVTVQQGQSVPNPSLVLVMENGRLRWPTAIEDFRNTPDWAKPLLEAALEQEV